MSLLSLKTPRFEDQSDKVLISKLTNAFLYVSVPLCFKDQHVVWFIQDLILKPAAKRDLLTSAKQEAGCSCVHYVVLQKLFSEALKKYCGIVVIYPLINRDQKPQYI